MATVKMTEPQIECPSVMVLAKYWQRRVKEIFGVEKHLTVKEFGQLKMLRSFLADSTSPVIEWTLANWSDFSWQARVEAGLPCSPSIPHIGFLLAHYDTARRWYLQSIAHEEREKRKAELRAKECSYLPPEGYYFDEHRIPRLIPETPEEREVRLAEIRAINDAFLAGSAETQAKTDQKE